MPAVEIVIRHINDLTEAQKQAVAHVDHIAFSGTQNANDPTVWASGEWQVMGYLDNQLVSIIGLLVRNATVDGQPITLGGVGGVATLPEWRFRGFAGELLRASEQFMREQLGVDFGLLVCAEMLVPYYRKFGWIKIEGPMVFDQQNGKQPWPEAIMVLPVMQSDWPSGLIDLCGLPW